MSEPGVNPNIGQIPNPGPQSLQQSVEAIKQAVDSLAGFRGDQLGRAVTFNDLIRLGLTTELAARSDRGASQLITSQFVTPADPTMTASAIGVMMGLGASLLAYPGPTGALVVAFTGDCSIDTNGAQGRIRARMAAGTPPANGDALTGATLGQPQELIVAAANQKLPFAIIVSISMLSPVQQVWFDLSLATSAGNALIENLNVTILQL